MSGLLVCRQVVPKHGCILEIGLWIALLSVDEKRELSGITDEENWCVIENPVPVAFLGVIFDREPSRVSSCVWGAFLSTDGGKSSDAASLLANTKEHVNGCDIADIVRDLEF